MKWNHWGGVEKTKKRRKEAKGRTRQMRVLTVNVKRIAHKLSNNGNSSHWLTESGPHCRRSHAKLTATRARQKGQASVIWTWNFCCCWCDQICHVFLFASLFLNDQFFYQGGAIKWHMSFLLPTNFANFALIEHWILKCQMSARFYFFTYVATLICLLPLLLCHRSGK